MKQAAENITPVITFTIHKSRTGGTTRITFSLPEGCLLDPSADTETGEKVSQEICANVWNVLDSWFSLGPSLQVTPHFRWVNRFMIYAIGRQLRIAMDVDSLRIEGALPRGWLPNKQIKKLLYKPVEVTTQALSPPMP